MNRIRLLQDFWIIPWENCNNHTHSTGTVFWHIIRRWYVNQMLWPLQATDLNSSEHLQGIWEQYLRQAVHQNLQMREYRSKERHSSRDGISRSVGHSTSLVENEMKSQHLDGLPWNYIKTAMVPRAWLPLILVIPWLFSSSTVRSKFPLLWNISTSNWWIAQISMFPDDVSTTLVILWFMSKYLKNSSSSAVICVQCESANVSMLTC